MERSKDSVHESSGEGKPKCMPRDKAHSMSKKDRASSARRKRRQDPMADRPSTGNKPIMVKTDKKESVNESSNINKFKTAAREFDRNKDRNFQSVGDALSTIALRMRMMQSGKSKTGYSDYKGQEIIQKSASRIQGIVNNTFDKEEGKEIRKLLTKHGLYNKGAMGPIMKLTYNTEEKKAVKESINEAHRVTVGF